MKIVINKCYGGFGVSAKAVRRLLELDGPVEVMEPSQYFGKVPTDAEMKPYRRAKGEYGVIAMSLENGSEVMVMLDDKYDTQTRSNPILVQVVEELEKEANGASAKLQIIEIPDGIDWEIDEYDGMERVVERHRSWG